MSRFMVPGIGRQGPKLHELHEVRQPVREQLRPAAVGQMYVVFDALNRILSAKNISIARSLVGNYITSLEMAGCSITLVRLDDELTKYWDAPVHTPALRWGM